MRPIKLLLAIVAMGLLAFASHAQSWLTNGLVAYYPFNGNANDESGNGNDAANILAASGADRFGNPDQAYNFNGTDNYIDFANVPTTQTDNWSVVVWLKPASLNQSGFAVSLGYDDGTVGNGYSFGISAGNAADGNQLYAIFGSVGVFAGGFTFSSTNQWYQVVMLRSSGVTSIFVNGVRTATGITATPQTPSSFRIGSENGTRFFNGGIDDVRIYNRGLSSNEVVQLYAIENAAPVITSQPTNVTVKLGDTAVFNVTATSLFQLEYQWFKDAISLPNATNATLTLTNVQPNRIGNYSVVLASSGGSVASRAASLSISNINSALWQGLIAYYPFAGNANDAAGTNEGINNQTALCADRFGNPNQAYNFNGTNSYIDFPGIPTSQVDNWTMTAWLKPASLGQRGIAVCLGYDNGVSANGFSFGVFGPGSAFGNQLYEYIGNVGVFAGGFTFSSTNKWYQVVVLRDSGVTRYFVNGLVTSNSTTASPHTPSSFRIGSENGIRFFNGAIDDVRIYSRAMSSNEVALLYATETPTHTATGTATLAGAFIVGMKITDGGGGYTNTPQVRFIGGGGSGAAATAVVSNGVVVAINLISAGSGYTNAPLVVMDPPFISIPVLQITPTSILSFNNLTVGSNYQLQQFQSWYWTNQPVSFTATNPVFSQPTPDAAQTGQYRLALKPVPNQAFATPQVLNGFVFGATITAGGSGYVTTPAVNIRGDVGSNATAIASISGGAVTGITLTSAGIGYTNQVTVQIDPPPAVALSPAISPGVRVDSSRLAPYDNYQLQFKSNLTGAWGNWSGGSFSPTAETNSQYIFITNSAGFIRLQYVP